MARRSAGQQPIFGSSGLQPAVACSTHWHRASGVLASHLCSPWRSRRGLGVSKWVLAFASRAPGGGGFCHAPPTEVAQTLRLPQWG